MNSTVALTILLVASICLVGYTDAWGFGRRRSNSSSRWSSRRNSTGNYNDTSVIGVRRVDEEHPYFRSYDFSRNSTNTLDALKQGLREFFNASGNVTWLVKNDRLLMSRDADVRKLQYKDQLEVWFTNSSAPTRAKTAYAFSKEARKTWSRKDKSDKDKSGGGKDKRKDRRERVRGRTESEEEEDQDQMAMIDMDSF